MNEGSFDPRAAAALERNDRYLREFVEAFNLCPYAKRCREEGALHRVVLLDAGGAPGTASFEAAVEALDGAISGVEREPAGAVEVALILFPALAPVLARDSEGARNFEQLLAAARARAQARHPRADMPFYCVAFHPGFTGDLGDAHRAVRLIRRSPDPTVQLVRASVLRAVRGANPGGSHYVDVSGMSATELMALAAPVSVSDRIGAANLRTLRALGGEAVDRLLHRLAGPDPSAPP